MYSRLVIAAGISVGLLVAGPSLALAKHEHGGEAHTHEGACASGEAGCAESSGQATKNPCEHCQQAAKNLDDVMAKLDKAKQSNDVAAIRTAIEEAQKPLAQLKEHMATCQMKMSKAERMCSMCNVKLDKDGRCPQCGMKM